MVIKDKISINKKGFKTICRNHNVKFLFAFGSSTTDKFDEEKSDIDLIVEIDDPDPIERGEKLISLWDLFEVFFSRKVDLLTTSSIKNPFLKKNIEATKILIYDGSSQKILV
ncbi:MAG: DNA polymerase subunit beta [Bacteroidetes bacterium GWF2_38_335]|nr:MAG: DNA polymerase subunit beta [Bacteroidetes bacterium GWF2_38_335]OFY80471.1 MAG: DNA polymerase subunit beta [Bacteroidetes bacterium RIFOXYA12_FULL_38_20]HBS85921.1 DNA polymerase subunit beta [Bacteroidales bacterium]